MMNKNSPDQSQLGKSTDYDAHYNPDKLFPIPRIGKRDEIDVPAELPFTGFDLWNHYEVSWLDKKGKPVVAMAVIQYPCESPCIIESKSMKLYFNSFNNTKFQDENEVSTIISKDISERVGGDALVNIIPLNKIKDELIAASLSGECLDDLDIECDEYMVNASYLVTENEKVEETLHSNLLKSNCLVTNQPDWGSVQIEYRGNKINREGLLKYLVSFRNHNEFHEQCIERIFMDILRQCQPEELTVYGRYTRRGGLDINPFRTSKGSSKKVANTRLCRQ